MTVYRIENPSLWPNDIGPYKFNDEANCVLREMANAHANYLTHPNYRYDRLSYDRPLACPSFKLLRQWFAGYTGHLALHGFKCYAIRVHPSTVKIGKSGKQCQYNPNTVISRKRISFVTGKPLN